MYANTNGYMLYVHIHLYICVCVCTYCVVSIPLYISINTFEVRKIVFFNVCFRVGHKVDSFSTTQHQTHTHTSHHLTHLRSHAYTTLCTQISKQMMNHLVPSQISQARIYREIHSYVKVEKRGNKSERNRTEPCTRINMNINLNTHVLYFTKMTINLT